VDSVEPLLKACGFVDVKVVCKEQSKEFIAKWLPDSGCENYVISANITATKPAGEVQEEEEKKEETALDEPDVPKPQEEEKKEEDTTESQEDTLGVPDLPVQEAEATTANGDDGGCCDATG